MEETKMFFPVTLTEFWKKFRITVPEVVTEKLSSQIFPQADFYVFRKGMLFRNNMCDISKLSRQIFYPQPKAKSPENFKTK